MAPIQRYTELVEQIKWRTRVTQRLAGMSLEIEGWEQAISVATPLFPICPHFPCADCTGPVWGGYGAGLASSRAGIDGGLPTAG